MVNEEKVNVVFLKLLMRGKDIGDGWRNVSETLTPYALGEVKKSPELFEVEQPEGEKLRIRLTERGKILSEYV